MEKTSCYSYFAIGSSGTIENGIGFVAAENSDFNPDYITEMLKIQPFETRKMGTPRENGFGEYPFSEWACLKQTRPALDAEVQLKKIIRVLKKKIPRLLGIKKKFNVSFSILIVPSIYHGQTPGIVFDREIIEFCYLTGTEIGVDLYVFDE